MKKGLVAVVVFVLVLSNIHSTKGAETIKILVDESRVFGWDKGDQEDLIDSGWPKDSNWDWSFENDDQMWGFSVVRKKLEEIGTVDIRKSGTLSYSTLKNYDVLVLASYSESYSSSEAAEIKKFVENGGGLLLLGDYDLSPNSVSRSFDVLFCSETALVAEKKGFTRQFVFLNQGWTISKPFVFYAEDINSHPVTEDIDKLTVALALPITSHSSGTVLVKSSADSWLDKGNGVKGADEEAGPFDLVLASEVGKGRAVFIGSLMSFTNAVADNEKQNVTLIGNAVEWLGEPGGPHKQYKIINEQAQQAFSSAVTLFASHKFSEAKTAFEGVIPNFEESNSIYQNSEATKGIADANAYIAKCETGMKADQTFANASSIFNSRDYEKAIEEFNKAKSLYDEIGYTEKSNECTTKVDESNKWIALRDKAKEQFQVAEDAFSKAPSTFSTTGYEQAQSLYEEARETWQEYNDPAQVTACEEKISQCDTEIAKIKKNVMMVIVTVVAVIAVVIVAVVFIRKRKPKAAIAPPSTAVPEPAPPEPVPGADPLKILEDRYSRGEITKEEYEKLKSALQRE